MSSILKNSSGYRRIRAQSRTRSPHIRFDKPNHPEKLSRSNPYFDEWKHKRAEHRSEELAERIRRGRQDFRKREKYFPKGRRRGEHPDSYRYGPTDKFFYKPDCNVNDDEKTCNSF